MVRANQSGHINKSQSLCAGAAPACETDGDIGPTLRDRDNDRAEFELMNGSPNALKASEN